MNETRPQEIISAIKETMTVTVSGPPGSGKSTLLNHIVNSLEGGHFFYKVDQEKHVILVRIDKQAFPERSGE